MLVISRKDQEVTVIEVAPSDKPSRIEIMVVEIDRNKIRLGFTADRPREEVVIVRKELLDQPENPAS